MLEGDSAGFNVNHLNRDNIIPWSKEGEPRLVINKNSEMGSKFLVINLGFRHSGTAICRDK
jgi:hypothetical protein